ncbi:MAG: type II toxin-antitoxin system HicB family antitoxin [Gammaproteobacteria bacterium]|nr:type II toxin-antitoxin system HicB family antitoxin [Gammaproteobacteria bacterium]
MRYPIAIETGDKRHAYGVVVPDLPGCFSAGDTLEETLTNAREAILLHLEGLLEDQTSLPQPSALATLQRKREFRGWTWAVVDVDLSELGEKATRINISLPQRILRAIDSHARRSGETRSGFLARAAIDAMRGEAGKRSGGRPAK